MDILEKFIINEIKKDQIEDIVLKIAGGSQDDEQLIQDLSKSIEKDFNKIPNHTKYMDWVLYMIDNGEIYNHVVNSLSLYIDNKKDFVDLGIKSLNKSITPSEIEKLYKENILKPKEDDFSVPSFNNAHLIYNSKNWVAYLPTDMKSSIECATSSAISRGGVRWCTTMKDAQENQFYEETDENNKLIYLMKKGGNTYKNIYDKIALKINLEHFFSIDEIFDANDDIISVPKLKKILGNELNKIIDKAKKHFESELTNRSLKHKEKLEKSIKESDNLDELYKIMTRYHSLYKNSNHNIFKSKKELDNFINRFLAISMKYAKSKDRAYIFNEDIDKIPEIFNKLYSSVNFLGGIKEIPENIKKVDGDLKASRFSSIESIPDGIEINGDLDLTGNKKIKKLPENMKIKGSLKIGGTNINSLPNNIFIGGHLYLVVGGGEKSSVVSLPKDLSNFHIGGSILEEVEVYEDYDDLTYNYIPNYIFRPGSLHEKYKSNM